VVIPGNSFDFSSVHGASLIAAGYSFASVSDEAVLDDSLDLAGYHLVDYLAGEERRSFLPKNDSVAHFPVFPGDMLEILDEYLESGGRVFISGAHIASDVHEEGRDSLAASVLGYHWRTSNASRQGRFYLTDSGLAPYTRDFLFNTGIHPGIYTVEGADALEPADSTARTLVRYRENNKSAGVLMERDNRKVLALGFPFESIVARKERDHLMELILENLLDNE
jgi:hypothetical protein